MTLYDDAQAAAAKVVNDAIAAEQSANASLSARLDAANTTIGELNVELAKAQSDDQADQTTIAQLRGQVAELLQEVADLQAQLDALQTPALLGHFDSFPLRVGAGSGAYGSNKGVSDAMKAAGGRGSQIMHAYASSGTDWATDYASSKVAKSGEFGHAFLLNQGIPGGTFAGVINGSQDSQIAAWFNSVPTTETCYVTMNSEPENDAGISAPDFCKAMGHIVNISAPIYAARGLKGGVGGLLMGSTFRQPNPTASFAKWNWLQYVTPAAMPYAVYMIDCYSKYLDAQATTYESIPDTVELAFSQARPLGCQRFVLGEFAVSREQRNTGGKIVGNAGTQATWIAAEIPKIRAIAGLEAALYFAKPGGAESKNAELVDDATGKPFTAYAKMI